MCASAIEFGRVIPILWNPDRGSACVAGRRSGGRAALQPPATFLSPCRAVVDGPDAVREGHVDGGFPAEVGCEILGVGCHRAWVPITRGGQSRMGCNHAAIPPTSAFPIRATNRRWGADKPIGSSPRTIGETIAIPAGCRPTRIASPKTARFWHDVPEGVPEGSRGFRAAVPPERGSHTRPEPR
jgi:hypothetical protein